MRILAASTALLFALVLPGLASAASRPTVQLKLTGSVVSKSADGRTLLTPVEKEAPKSGDTVEYAIAATNVGTAPALKLMPQGKIPAGTSYVEGSAKAQRAKVEFSLDQGKTWSASPTVTVKGPSGTPLVKKADPSLYTTIRFVTDGALAPHGTALYSYEVRVK
jgi:uncharacterized repeat protein (TIGR01451 family)